ncbi:MAG: hypothetical protein D6731_19275 [Planctomycetota bacterium]|nr:MAG: hypothetical protein D6731_19275 [Planctomycetota bacterium]
MSERDDDEDLLGISERIDRLQLGKLMLSVGNFARALELLEPLVGKYAGEDPERDALVRALVAQARAGLDASEA